MCDRVHNYIHTISASAMSSREKLLLICLITRQKNGKCRICQAELSRLTSTSIRHLSRIINKLEQEKLLRIIRLPGQCHTYILPASYFCQKNQLVADWTIKKDPENQQDGKQWHSPELIKAWQSAFSTKYQPVTPEEQKAMDYMLFARNSGQLCMIKSPVAYLRTLVRNGHPADFPDFSKRQKMKENRAVSVTKNDQKEQKKLDQKWHIYTNMPKSQQKKLRNKFKSKFLTTQPRQVVDIFDKNGFQHPIINALYRTYVARHVA